MKDRKNAVLRLIICGFDMEFTEKIVSFLTERFDRKKTSFSSAYEWTDNMRADDAVCHFIMERNRDRREGAAYIPRGHADMMLTRDLVHAVPYLDMLRHRAYVITAGCSEEPRGDVRISREQLIGYVKGAGLRLKIMNIKPDES